MPLPSERRRIANRDALEAAGVDLWTDELPPEARVKLAAAWRVLEDSHDYEYSTVSLAVSRTLALETGRRVLSPDSDLLGRVDDTDLALDLVAALHKHLRGQARHRDTAATLEAFTNKVLEDHRVAYRMLEGEILPMANDVLHTQVVEPALQLLVSQEFESAGRAYVKAIKAVPVDPSDAVTAAGTALQETLEALGCSGNALGPLIADAKKRALLAAHDVKLTAGIEKLLDWTSADRSNTGGSHHFTEATQADAWLTIHVVGALIVRLADSGPRRSSGSSI